MKKLVLLLAVVCSVSLFSCGNKAEQNAEAADATENVESVEGVEPACCDKAECEGEACQGDSTKCANCCTEEVAAETTEVVTE